MARLRNMNRWQWLATTAGALGGLYWWRRRNRIAASGPTEARSQIQR